MVYVMSDLHGCLDTFKKALEMIHFTSKDTLYILGDCIDRGNQSIALLFEMMSYPNIYPILGNHEYMAYQVLNKLTTTITKENADSFLQEEDLLAYYEWITNGGYSTIKEYQQLSLEDKEMILDYLSEFSAYEVVTVNQIKYVLVHAGFEPYIPSKSLEKYQLHELLFTSPTTTYQNATYIVGHKVVDQITKIENTIYIDCGLIYQKQLGILCLDTMQEYYQAY